MGPIAWLREEWTEAKDAAKELWQFAKEHDWKRSGRNSLKRKYWGWWAMLLVLIAIMVLASLYRETIVEWLQPHKEEIVSTSCTWLIPIAALVILSIPPLGGHEIILLLIGIMWGPWIGFGICAAGTFFGEMACFWAFKYYLTEKAREIEEANIFYACVARLMAEGGITVVTVMRYSAVPGHIITALQSTVSMSIWVYMIAVFLSLPKPFAFVYLGVAVGRVKGDATPAELREQSLINWATVVGVALATILSLYIVYMRARRLYPVILEEQGVRGVEEGARGREEGEFEVLGVSLVEAAMDGVDGRGEFENLSDEEHKRGRWARRGEEELRLVGPGEGRGWQDGPAAERKASRKEKGRRADAGVEDGEEARRARRMHRKEREAQEEIAMLERAEREEAQRRYGSPDEQERAGVGRSNRKLQEADEEVAELDKWDREKRRPYSDDEEGDEPAPRYDELSLLSREEKDRKRRDSRGGDDGWN